MSGITADHVIQNYGQIEDSDRGMKVRINGWDCGSALGWFHMHGGWCVLAMEFQPNDYFRKKYVEAGHCFDMPMTKMKGLAIDFYIGRMALVSHPTREEKEGEITTLWEGPIT